MASLAGDLRDGELLWAELERTRARHLLRNPRYAGAYVYGQNRSRNKVDGTGPTSWKVPREQWHTLLLNAHSVYISWEEFEDNQRRMRENAQAYGADRRQGPPQEGPALLQGLAPPATVCRWLRRCRLPGRAGTRGPPAGIDADLAQRRYMQVDPDNRLVADALETEWNRKLRALAEAQAECERQRKADREVLDDEQHARILALATNFPQLWQGPQTPNRERKRMVRLILEDVTLLRHEEHRRIQVHIRFKGGVTRTLHLPIRPNAIAMRTTRREVIEEIDRLLDGHTRGQNAACSLAKK